MNKFLSSIFNIFSFGCFSKKKEFTQYVCGFLFSHCGKFVYLIRKKRPNWQEGFLNGVGGLVNKGETPEQAMCREAFEEAGVRLDPRELVYLEQYSTDIKNVRFYAILLKENDIPAGKTDEMLVRVRWMRNATQSWNTLKVLDNVPYLVNKGYWAILPFIEYEEEKDYTEKLFHENEALFTGKVL